MASWKEGKGAVRNTEEPHMLPVNGEYQCLTLDFRPCHFDLSSARRCVVNGRFLQPSIGKGDLHVVCKIVYVLHYPDLADLLQGEACTYVALQDLQGQVTPTLYGFYEVWVILQLLALESVGNAIPKDEQINWTLHMKMKAAL